ncbi:MAG: tRNA uridine-5-carboxymethylaminomethyl(34) synthesis GTPase MnmE [Chloroflexi bacterium]|nr:tRNA uridine-5-carboxymethylaminomethyl(34) synthesis GTPase MnmE [Chloroflexota bacterium]
MYEDTIVAISTPIGEGGIGIVRLSGEKARAIAGRLFTRAIPGGRLSYGHILDPESGRVVDEVLVSYMPAPHSYTREDVVEINCHGGPLPLQRVLGLCLQQGARLALPGEFTLRAFLNGRIDLAEAEAVLDIIRAKTEAGLRVAVGGLRGGLSERVKFLREDLMPGLANLTARIDFPEDQVEETDVIPVIERAVASLSELIETAATGMVYRLGVRTAIVGRPNVGKSSLLNILLGENRAIVTPVPGTTRDTLEETLNVQGVPFILVDTAGIIDTRDPVESLGVERSRNAIEKADLVLAVIDAGEPLQDQDREIFRLINGKQVIVVANKSDLPRRADLGGVPWWVVTTSALTGHGMKELRESLVKVALGGKVAASDALLVSNPRHKEALQRAKQYLGQALENLRSGAPDDLVTIDVTAALNALGEITGETLQDDLLDTIFSRFCVGK